MWRPRPFKLLAWRRTCCPLLLAAAWRRFRTRRIHAPLSRMGALSRSFWHPRLAYAFQYSSAGGLELPSRRSGWNCNRAALSSGLNTVGATVLW